MAAGYVCCTQLSAAPRSGRRVASGCKHVSFDSDMRYLSLLLGWIAFTVLWAGSCADVAAASEAPEIVRVRAGVGGHYKVGFWTPAWVTIRAGEQTLQGSLELVVQDGDGAPTEFVSTESNDLQIAAGETATLLRYVKIGRIGSGITVRLRAADGRESTRSFAASEIGLAWASSQELVLTIGNDIGVEGAARLHRAARAGRAPAVAARVTQADQLPHQWFGYEGVDTIALPTADDLIDKLTPSQIRAIELWTRLGGRLILSVGSRGRHVCGAGGALASLVPGRFVRVMQQAKTTELEVFAGASEPLLASGSGQTMPMTLLTDVRGRIESYEGRAAGEQPTLIRSALGFGEVVFAAFDLDRPPCAGWQGRSRLVDRLLAGSSANDRETRIHERSGRVAHIGYEDIAGQLRAAMDEFSGVTRFDFTGIAVLSVIYILLVGPADYLLLRKLGRAHWTWVTFPLLVVCFCVLAFWLAGAAKVNQVRINQVELIDIDAESSLVRGTAWAHIYSPQSETYNLSFEPKLVGSNDTRGVLLSWQGLPGAGLGGMQTKTAADLFRRPYVIHQHVGSAVPVTQIAKMPIQISSSKSLSVRWWGDTRLDVRSDLSLNNGFLRGEVTNPFPFELSRCVVVFGKWAYRLDRPLKAGETVSVQRDLREQSLPRYLTRRTVDNVGTPWSQTDVDIPRIVEIMMHFAAAGGHGYTNLTHDYQRFTDESELLDLGPAMLTGYAESSAGLLRRDDTLLTDSYDSQWTFYRIVLPVRVE